MSKKINIFLVIHKQCCRSLLFLNKTGSLFFVQSVVGFSGFVYSFVVKKCNLINYCKVNKQKNNRKTMILNICIYFPNFVIIFSGVN